MAIENKGKNLGIPPGFSWDMREEKKIKNRPIETKKDVEEKANGAMRWRKVRCVGYTHFQVGITPRLIFTQNAFCRRRIRLVRAEICFGEMRKWKGD